MSSGSTPRAEIAVDVNFHPLGHPGPTLGLTAWPESIDTSQIIVRWKTGVDKMGEGSCEQSGIAFARAEAASLAQRFRKSHRR